MHGTNRSHDELVALVIELEQRVRLGAPDYARLLRDIVRIEGANAGIIFAAVAPRLERAGFVALGEGLTAAHRQGGWDSSAGALLLVPTPSALHAPSALTTPFSVSHGVARGPRIGTAAAGIVAAVAAVEALEGAEIDAQPTTVVVIAETVMSGLSEGAIDAVSWAIELAPPYHPDGGRGDENALLALAGMLAGELDIEAPVAPPLPGTAAAALASAGKPVIAAAGPPLAEGDDAREAVDMEAFVRYAALVAALIAAYRPD